MELHSSIGSAPARRLSGVNSGFTLATAGTGLAQEAVKIGFTTKFPVPFFATMEDAAKAYAVANPGVEIIYGQGQSATDIEGQIARIESNAGIAPDQIVLVGFDFCCGEAEALAEGIEDATVAQFPAKMAELGVDALVRAIRGDAVPGLIDSGAAFVTPANMAEFQ